MKINTKIVTDAYVQEMASRNPESSRRLFQFGRTYTVLDVDRSERIRRRFHYKAKQCFANCQRRALNDADLLYVEGFATIVKRCPIIHAWLVHRDRPEVVLDPTRPTLEPDVYFFGMIISPEEIRQHILSNGYYGSILFPSI
jgi:hypothetical protein